MGKDETGIAAQGAKAMSGRLDGRIDVTASGGAKVNKVESTMTMPGNLGFNMSEGGML